MCFVRLLICNSYLLSDDSCRLCSAFLLSFGSTFLLGPFEHFCFHDIILCSFSNKFVSFLKKMIHALDIIDLIFGKLCVMLNESFKTGFQLIDHLLLFLLTFTLKRQIIYVYIVFTLLTKLLLTKLVLFPLWFYLCSLSY